MQNVRAASVRRERLNQRGGRFNVFHFEQHRQAVCHQKNPSQVFGYHSGNHKGRLNQGQSKNDSLKNST
jgi:hypothetical protein